jgi:hypothetical protein
MFENENKIYKRKATGDNTVGGWGVKIKHSQKQELRQYLI